MLSNDGFILLERLRQIECSVLPQGVLEYSTSGSQY